MYIHRIWYTWYIHVYPYVYTWYICGISMDISWMFLALWNQISWPASAAGLIQYAHVCGWSKSVLFHVTQWQLCHGDKAAHKRLNRTAATSPLCRWRRWWRLRRRQVSQVSFLFLVFLLATTWILVKDGGKGALKAGDQCVKPFRCLPELKIEKKIKFLFAKGSRPCSTGEPEWLVWMSSAIILNPELSFHLIRKQQTHDNTNLHSERFGTGIQ